LEILPVCDTQYSFRNVTVKHRIEMFNKLIALNIKLIVTWQLFSIALWKINLKVMYLWSIDFLRIYGAHSQY